MIIEPKIRNNVCLSAHPGGCAMQVREQINYVRGRGAFEGAGNVLVIGGSNGYGLAARIVAAFGCGSATVSVSYEKPGTEKRSGTSGWYNDRAFEEEAGSAGLAQWTINGDAFTREVKQQVAGLIEEEMGSVDLIVYSIAAPRRLDPDTGELYSSAIKPIGKPYTSKTVDFQTGELKDVTAEPASEEEASHTVKVMGGEDWMLWIQTLLGADVVAPAATTVAFSYIGPELTFPIYRSGTIGRAKRHLEETTRALQNLLHPLGGRAVVSINKALVTRASAVIPGMPLYIALLYRVMKARGLHEGCIEQMYRMFTEHLYAENPAPADDEGRIRLDDREMRPDVQAELFDLWDRAVREGRIDRESFEEFRREFLRHHGFDMAGIDYGKDVTP